MKAIRVYAFLSEIADAARTKGWRFAPPIATYGGPVQAFRIALRAHPDAWNVLIDGEDPDEAALREKGLQGCDPERIFWMVQIMESWFLADPEALEKLFGKTPPAGNPKVEEIPKKDILERLKKVAGEYHNVKHGAKLLASVGPGKVRKAAPNRDRMFRLNLTKLG